jgi:hypothetical protein
MESSSFSLLAQTALAARDHLSATASSNERGERRMAALGATALFQEALLSALRAHLAEFKTVAR